MVQKLTLNIKKKGFRFRTKVTVKVIGLKSGTDLVMRNTYSTYQSLISERVKSNEQFANTFVICSRTNIHGEM